MKAKSLFLVLALFLLSPLSVKAAVSTDVFIVPSGAPDIYATINPSTYGATSGATYSGEVDYDSNYPLVWMDNSKVWATTGSPGKAKSVTIYWDLSGDYNSNPESIIYIYGQNSAYTGSETLGTMSGTLLASQSYNGTASHTFDISGYDCSFVAIVGSADGFAFNRLEIAWTVPDVATYVVSTSKTGSGSISISPASPVAVGAEVTVTFTGLGSKNEVNSFIIDGASTVLSEDEYTKSVSRTFTMPAHAVDISAVFASKPSRSENVVSIDGTGGSLDASIESGTERSFTISTQYNGSTSPSYTAGLKSVTSTTGKVTVVSNTFNSSTGTGTITLRGLAAGSDALVITTYQTNGCQRSTGTINVTVTSRDVALITELNDRYYAVTHTFGGGGTTVTAQELIKQGANYYYKSGVVLSDITWKYEYANAAGTKFYIKNSAGKYLTVDAATVSVEDASFQWSKNASDAFVTGYLTGLCYDEDFTAFTINNQNEYKGTTTISAPIYEVSISNILPATEYTRSLTSGNYATMCLPFPVSRSEEFLSGINVFNITGKYMSGSNITGIEMAEVEGILEAGKPYIIQATAATLSAWYGEATAMSPVSATGLVGNLGSAYYVPVGGYIISSNKIRRVAYANTGSVGQYKAYLDLSAVPDAGGVSAPGRRVLYAENTEDTVTSLEDFLNNASEINWNEPVYNMLGQRVGKGTKGVLVQNGQKFLIQ
ncbi:MAG: hypothetical protein IJT12_07765 [Paludibacteraceae bacterium]|nr:hypothetical protein [Paludibacteraceae bacterium]